MSTNDLLRRRFQGLRGFHMPSSLWSRIETQAEMEQGQLAASPPRGRLMVALSASLIGLVAVAAAGWSLLLDGPNGAGAGSPPAPELSLDFTVPLGPSSDAIWTQDHAWVWRLPANDRLSPTIAVVGHDGTVIDSVAVQSHPVVEAGGAGMATGDGSVWVVGTQAGGTGAHLTRVDVAMGEVVKELGLPSTAAIDVAVGETAIWVAALGDGDQGLLLRVDPETYTIQTALEADDFLPRALLASSGTIFMLGATGDGDVASGGQVISWEEASEENVVTHFASMPSAASLDGSGRPWVAVGQELHTLETGADLVVGDGDRSVTSLAPRPEGMWLVSHAGSADGSALSVVDTMEEPVSGEISSPVRLFGRAGVEILPVSRSEFWLLSGSELLKISASGG